eukprot:IDg10971t1
MAARSHAQRGLATRRAATYVELMQGATIFVKLFIVKASEGVADLLEVRMRTLGSYAQYEFVQLQAPMEVARRRSSI